MEISTAGDQLHLLSGSENSFRKSKSHVFCDFSRKNERVVFVSLKVQFVAPAGKQDKKHPAEAQMLLRGVRSDRILGVHFFKNVPFPCQHLVNSGFFGQVVIFRDVSLF